MNTSTIRFKAKAGRSDLNYLKHWINGKDFRRQMTRLVTGSAQKNFGPSHLKEVVINLPPLDEQRRIAAILDKADAIRRKRQQALALADDFLRSAFLEMFGDPVANPRGWEVVPLGELGEVKGGLQVTSARASNSIQLPYLRVANVYRERLELDEIKVIGVTEREARDCVLQSGDVLIVEGHGNPEELGRSAVWSGAIKRCTHQNHLIRFRANKTMAAPRYISAFINSKGGRRQLLSAGKTTSGLNTISTRNVRELDVLLPPLELQQRYTNFVEMVSAGMAAVLQGIQQSEVLFASLSQRAFRGEL